jgi:formate hydrogenlyase subunit 3/multisubunit Na+/H+ antiporter MnhD subunit
MSPIHAVVLPPLAAGVIFFLFPRKSRIASGILTVLVTGAVLAAAVQLFLTGRGTLVQSLAPAGLPWSPAENGLGSGLLLLRSDPLSRIIVLFTCFFGFLFSLYSLPYMTGHKRVSHYYSLYLITIGASAGAALADHLLLFITFWGVLGLTLYKMIDSHSEGGAAAAKKSFILIGASDSVVLFGIGLLWAMTGGLRMSGISLPTTDAPGVIAFVALLVGSITKAGAFPLHTWIPDYAEHAPASSSALLPASLDKLLGIYLLARITMELFILNQWLHLTILIIGGTTIITAVFMALVQHNYKRILGFHAVSQVGYMVTGFGLGTPLGIAGGFFHMLNHALYKSGLFLTAGSVEKRTGEEDLQGLGGLSRVMPLTFIAALVCALSISGVPPFNGFASKWIIYQAIIDFGKGAGAASRVWVLWLVMAVFGSALTLASFIKLISGIYLGRLKTGAPGEGTREDAPGGDRLNAPAGEASRASEPREVSILMWLPQLFIAAVCILFGVLAVSRVVPVLIEPVAGSFPYPGIWSAGIVTLLIAVSIVLGIIIYLLGSAGKRRVVDGFIGGELIEKTGFSAVEFYKTVSEIRPLAFFYRNAEKRLFDIYDGAKNAVLGLNTVFSRAHSGVLPLYALWVVGGLLVAVVVLLW